MNGLALVIAFLFTLAPATPPLPATAKSFVTIINHASPAAGGFSIRLDAGGLGSISSAGSTQNHMYDRALAQRLFAELEQAAPVSGLQVRACRRMMSGATGAITVTFLGAQSPGDLSCGGDATVNALWQVVRAVIEDGGIATPVPRLYREVK